MTMNGKKIGAVFTAVIATTGFGLGNGNQAWAQTGVLHRHPHLSAIAAGVAAHHVAKRAASRRRASGRRPNFAERHPILSGAAAAAATHHVLKHH